MATNSSENLTDEQTALSERIFNLVIRRVFEDAYSQLDEVSKKEMEQVFQSGDAKTKEKYIKKNIPNFKSKFSAAAEKVEEEIRVEIEKQLED